MAQFPNDSTYNAGCGFDAEITLPHEGPIAIDEERLNLEYTLRRARRQWISQNAVELQNCVDILSSGYSVQWSYFDRARQRIKQLIESIPE